MKKSLLVVFLILSQPRHHLSAEPVPTDVTILTQKDFVGRPVFSVADALEGVVSINMERQGYVGTRAVAKMRGASSSKNTVVLIDGEPLTHDYDAAVDLSQIPISLVDRIEISRGGGSVALTGEAATGVINIITVRPQEKGFVTRLGTNVARDGVKESQGYITGRSNLGDVTYAGSVETSGGFLDNEGFKSNTHFVNLTRSFKGKGFWGAEYYFHDAENGLPKGTPIAFSEWNGHLERTPSDPDAEQDQTHQFAKVYLASPEFKKGNLYLTVRRNIRSTNLYPSPSAASIRDQENRSYDADLKWKRKGFEAGLENRSMKRNIFPQPENRATQNGAYAFQKWSHHQWTVVPGLRYDHHSRAGGGISPRIALLYTPGKTISFSGTAQAAHRFPNFDELFFSSGVLNNAHLNPEKSVSADVGTSWSPNPSFTAQVTGFSVRIKDLIQSDANSVLANNGEEKNQGIESRIVLRSGQKSRYRNIELRANWTTQSSRRNNPSLGTGYVDSPLSPRHIGRAQLDYKLPRKITITNEVRYQSEQFELANRAGVKIPPYGIWNARLELKMLSADLYFQADNLTGRRYADALGTYSPTSGPSTTVLSPQAYRVFSVGITIRFTN